VAGFDKGRSISPGAGAVVSTGRVSDVSVVSGVATVSVEAVEAGAGTVVSEEVVELATTFAPVHEAATRAMTSTTSLSSNRGSLEKRIM